MSLIHNPTKPPKPPKPNPPISKKLQPALDAMIWQGLDYHKAAGLAGYNAQNLRLQLTKPHVVMYLAKQRQMLLSGEGLRTIHRLVEIRDAANNMPAVTAGRVLLDLEAEQRTSTHAGASSAGITIHINGPSDSAVQRQRVIASEDRPIIEHEGPIDVVPDPPPVVPDPPPVVSGRKGG